MMNKNDLLLTICKMAAVVSVSDPRVYSIPLLSRLTGETKYRVRKLIKELEADGLIAKTQEGCIDEGGYPYCYHGWSITRKTVESEIYKKCNKEALKDYEQFMREFDEKLEREHEH